jgi:hypothetical protein
MTTTKILPYVYKLTHKTTREFYYGVRWANTYPAELDLGPRYKSSSKVVKPKFDEYDAEIIAEFFDKEDAIDFEQKIIEENWHNPLLLNKAIQVSKVFRCTGHTDATKLKMSAAKVGKAPNNKGKKLSKETVEKIRASSSGRAHSDESKEKIRQLAMGNKRGIGNKSRTGQKQAAEEKQNRKLAQPISPFKDKTHSDEWKEQRRLVLSKQPIRHCPHCNGNFKPSPFTKFHGDKCKSRIDSQGSPASTAK